MATAGSLSACGGSTDKKDITGAASSCTPYPSGDPLVSPDLPTQQVDSALAAKVPSDWAGRTLKMSVAPDLPGVNFAGDGGQRGFEPDLLRAAAERMGVKVAFIQSNSPLDQLLSGKVDGIAGFTADTKEREAQGLQFLDYMSATVGTLVQACNPLNITSDQDLCGKKLTAAKGTIQASQATETGVPGSLVDLCKAAGRPAPEFIVSDTTAAASVTLGAGRVDALVIDKPIAGAIAQTSGGKLDVGYTEVVSGQPTGLIFGAVAPEFVDALRASLQTLVADGTYGDIMTSYGIDEESWLDPITVNGATR